LQLHPDIIFLSPKGTLALTFKLLNSRMEAAVDHASWDHHQQVMRGKSIGREAILVILLNVFSAWLLILLN
jgi:diacylglycerol kinase